MTFVAVAPSQEIVGLAAMLDRMATVDADGVARARASLAIVLDPLQRSTWPEVAWQFSRLTGDGTPVELAFTSDGADVRYIAEVAGPELMDAARVEGATTFKTFRYIMLPLMRPIAATVIVLTLIESWNDYLLPLVFLTGPSTQTVTLLPQYFQGQFTYDETKILASAVISCAPIIFPRNAVSDRLMWLLTVFTGMSSAVAISATSWSSW